MASDGAGNALQKNVFDDAKSGANTCLEIDR